MNYYKNRIHTFGGILAENPLLLQKDDPVQVDELLLFLYEREQQPKQNKKHPLFQQLKIKFLH